MESDLKIRTMTLKDLQMVFSWAEDLDWRPILADAESFFQADPNGFFIGEIDGKPICSLAAIKYESYCFWSYFMVQYEYRGKGYGGKMLAHAAEYCKDSEVLSLQSCPYNFGIYDKYGFKSFCPLACYTKKAEGTMNEGLVRITLDMIDEVVDYDLKVFGYPRKAVLESLITRKNVYCVAAVKENRVVGFGVMRERKSTEKGVEDEYYLGPVNADDKDIAGQILEGLQSYVVGKNIYGQILERNTDAIEVMKTQKWEEMADAKGLTRMCAKGIPKFDMKRLYMPLDEIG